MIKVPSTQVLDYIRDNITYNPDTGLLSKKGKPIGSRRKKDNCIVVSMIVGKTIDNYSIHYTGYASQVIWYLTYDTWPSRWIDHIDGDRTNNRLNNLRYTTREENARNVRKSKHSMSSKYKGVHHRTDVIAKPWRAYINIEGKRTALGYYATEEEAAIAYDTKAIEVFGEYAKCNFGENSAVSGYWQQLILPNVMM
jgi:hypothetical protein